MPKTNLFTVVVLFTIIISYSIAKSTNQGTIENTKTVPNIDPEKAKAIADWIKVLDARTIEQAEGCNKGSCLDEDPVTGQALCPAEEAQSYNYVMQCLKHTKNPYSASECYKVGNLSDTCQGCITGCLRLRAYATCLGVVNKVEGMNLQ